MGVHNRRACNIALWRILSPTISIPSTTNSLSQILFLVSFVTVIGTILAFGLYLSGLQRLSATEIGVASSSEPIVSAAAAYIFLGVILTVTQYLGGALIIVAVILVASRRESAEGPEII